MTPEQAAAYVHAQVELCSIEKEMMIASNKEREAMGMSPHYGASQWEDFLEKWENILGHNAVMTLFHQVNQ